MRILHLSTEDVGGGFTAAYRLHANMRKAGVDSAMLVYHKRSSDNYVTSIAGRVTPLERLSWRLGRLRDRYDHCRGYSTYFRVDRFFFLSDERLKGMLPFVPDAIIIHWVANFLTPAIVARLSTETGAPLYWHMLDMAPLTGGCHYAFDCDRYKSSCGFCPQLAGSAGEFDVSRRQLEAKRLSFQACALTGVAASTWLRRQAEASAMFSKRSVRQIMLGMDVDVFKPVPAAEARTLLGLPQNKKIIFFGAQDAAEKRKGLTFLIKALDILRSMLAKDHAVKGNILVVTAGSIKNVDKLGIPFEHRHIGLLRDESMLAAAYQAADVFVNPSIEDSGPMMINESILCGTPVASFDMGVAPDLVHTGRTGYRAILKDTTDLARGLYSLIKLEPTQADAMRTECRKLGLRLCNSQAQVRAFVELCASGIESAAKKQGNTGL